MWIIMVVFLVDFTKQYRIIPPLIAMMISPKKVNLPDTAKSLEQFFWRDGADFDFGRSSFIQVRNHHASKFILFVAIIIVMRSDRYHVQQKNISLIISNACSMVLHTVISQIHENFFSKRQLIYRPITIIQKESYKFFFLLVSVLVILHYKIYTHLPHFTSS